MKVTIAYTGRGYHTAESLPKELDLADGADVTEALAVLQAQLPEGQSLPESCLVAVSNRHLGTVGQCASHPLRDGDELSLIAPVAGG